MIMCASQVRRGIYRDEMGLGKTITALAHISFRAKEQADSYTLGRPEEQWRSVAELNAQIQKL